MTSWYNDDGLLIKGGRDRAKEKNTPQKVSTDGVTEQVVFPFDLKDLTATVPTYTTDRDNDGTVDGFNTGDFRIPDQAIIESAVVYLTDEAGAGGTSIKVGTFQEDGTAIDDDGLVTATNGAVANLTANSSTAGSGALLGTGVTEASYVGLTTAGTFTAGKGYVIIKYVYARFT